MNRVRVALIPVLAGLLAVPAAMASENGMFDTYTGSAAFSACTGCHTGATSSISGYEVRVYKNSISAANRLSNISDTISKNLPTTLLTYLVGSGANAGGFNLFASSGTFTAGGDTRTNGTGEALTANNTQITHVDVNGIGIGFPPGGKADSGTTGDVTWSYTYNPPNTTGTVTFSLCGNPVNGDAAATGDDGPNDTGNVPICSAYTVSIVNDQPTAANDGTLGATYVNVDEGGTVNNATDANPGNNDLRGNDNDINGDALTTTQTACSGGTASGPANAASFTLNGNGTFTYQHNGGETTADSFTYCVSDGSLRSTRATVFISINPINDPPTATDDGAAGNGNGFVEVAEGGTINTVTSVLDNDNDPDDVETATQSLGGCTGSGPFFASAFTLNANGTFSYTHDGDIETETQDSFTYCAWDGSARSVERTAYIDINLVNDPPVISGYSGDNLPAYTENTSGTIVIDGNLVLGDNDDSNLESATLTVSPYDAGKDVLGCGAVAGGINCSPGGATLTLANSASLAAYQSTLRAITYANNDEDPDPATRTFSLVVNDGTDNSGVASKTMVFNAVNDPPVAAADTGLGNDFVTVDEGGSVDNGTDADGGNNDLRANDSDFETASTGLVTTQTLGGCAGSGPSNAASFTLDGDGTFSYTHDGSNTISDAFTYCAYDGALASSEVTVAIRVVAQNDLPVVSGFTGPTPFTEQTPVVIDSSVTITDGDTAPQIQQAQLQITNAQAGDELGCTTLPAGITGCSWVAATGTLTISGQTSLANYETAIEGVEYNNSGDHPNQSARNVSLVVQDDLGGFSGVVNASITPITRVNDRPVAVDDGSPAVGYVSVDEGARVDNGSDASGANDDLRANDSDPDFDALIATQANCDGGTASPPTNAAAFSLDADGSFSYTHNGSETTSDSFTYCVSDGALQSNLATVFISIVGINDAPIVTGFGGSAAFSEQTPITLNTGVDITDAESASLDGATLQITGAYVEGEDTLACGGGLPPGISGCSFDAPSGTLTLAGTASLASYMAAIDAVRFDNSSDNPDTTTRTVTLIVEDQDDGLMSAALARDITVTRLNDPPTLDPIAEQVAFEDTADDPYTFSYTALASDVDVDDSNTGNGTLTYSLSGHPAGMTISNAAANPGEISWQPPVTGIFGNVIGPITVSIEDGDEDGSPPLTETFSITVSPPDDDADQVANYDDLCLTVADPTNADNDNDGTPGSNGADAVSGGDVCDDDDDNDTMPDDWENLNSLDPFDASDAGADADGDGVSNLQEFLDGTSPQLANLVIDATGYLTAFKLHKPDPRSIHAAATAVRAGNPGPYRPGVNDVTWIPSNSVSTDLAASDRDNLVSDPPVQPFSIRPLVGVSAGQVAVEGGTVAVNVTLNGDSPSWPGSPVTVDYSVTGTAGNPADHDAAAGTLIFDDGVYSQTILFNVTADAVADPNETVVIALTGADHAAIGAGASHRVTIVEGNVAPTGALEIDQGGALLAGAFAGDNGGQVNIAAAATDINAGQALSYDWSGSANALVPPGDVAGWTTPALAAGNYLVDVLVTDNGSPPLSVRLRRMLNVGAGAAPALDAVDSDGDGVNDDDAAEGYGDDDGDGIPNYLDAHSAGASEGNLLPDQTVDPATSLLLQTEPGLRLVTGATARGAGVFGALLTDDEIADHGGADGGAGLGAVDDHEHFGGVFEFAVRGLVPGDSARVVIPLQSGIPRNAVLRKYRPDTGWSPFVSDAGNAVASAPGADGACPEAGSAQYVSGLVYLSRCIELLIEDGGVNDADDAVNGEIVDPAALGLRLTGPAGFDEVDEGGGSRMSPSLLALLLLLWGLALWRERRLRRG